MLVSYIKRAGCSDSVLLDDTGRLAQRRIMSTAWAAMRFVVVFDKNSEAMQSNEKQCASIESKADECAAMQSNAKHSKALMGCICRFIRR